MQRLWDRELQAHGSSRNRIISHYAALSNASPILLGTSTGTALGRGQPTDSFSARIFELKNNPVVKVAHSKGS